MELLGKVYKLLRLVAHRAVPQDNPSLLPKAKNHFLTHPFTASSKGKPVDHSAHRPTTLSRGIIENYSCRIFKGLFRFLVLQIPLQNVLALLSNQTCLRTNKANTLTSRIVSVSCVLGHSLLKFVQRLSTPGNSRILPGPSA